MARSAHAVSALGAVTLLVTAGCSYDWDKTWIAQDAAIDAPRLESGAPDQGTKDQASDAPVADGPIVDGPYKDVSLSDVSPSDVSPPDVSPPDVSPPDVSGPKPPVTIISKKVSTKLSCPAGQIAISGGAECKPGVLLTHSYALSPTHNTWTSGCASGGVPQKIYAVCLDPKLVPAFTVQPLNAAPTNKIKNPISNCSIGSNLLIGGGCGCAPAHLISLAPNPLVTRTWDCECSSTTTVWTYAVCLTPKPKQFNLLSTVGYVTGSVKQKCSGTSGVGGGCVGTVTRAVPTLDGFECDFTSSGGGTTFAFCLEF